jgi:hypothetical protein
MATYKVKGSQNLYDIALHLYGTIEGLFDLLISNPSLNMSMDLKPGMELEYHDDFIINPSIVNQFNEENIVPINGERSVYFKETDAPLRAIIKTPAELDAFYFSISGEGELIADWGDNTPLETISLTHTQSLIEHHFNNTVDSRRIRFYGDFSVLQLNATNMEGEMYLTAPMTVDEYVSHSNDNTLVGLFLFEDTYKVDLQRMLIEDLKPIYSMSLSQLNLLGAKFKSIDVLDDYLVNIVENHQNRRACEVWMDTEPTERGMQAIQTIIDESEWNTPTKWVFHINDQTYTAE